MDGLDSGAMEMGTAGSGIELGMLDSSAMEFGAQDMGDDDTLPIPRLPSWGQMVDHLSGLSVAPTPQRRGRKVSFETAEDKREDF
jgi:hypothetical protein